MSVAPDFDRRYREGDLPWETGRPDHNLTAFVEGGGVAPCRALDIGCGTGRNAVWLAGRGFDVVGVDLSPAAVDLAERHRREACVPERRCRFAALDFLADPVPGAPFGFLFDRGCFHGFDDPDQRRRFAARAAAVLSDGGVWLSLIGNADEPRDGEHGPPRRTAREVIGAVEPFFRIASLTAGRFDSDSRPAPLIWVLVARRRSVIPGQD